MKVRILLYLALMIVLASFAHAQCIGGSPNGVCERLPLEADVNIVHVSGSGITETTETISEGVTDSISLDGKTFAVKVNNIDDGGAGMGQFRVGDSSAYSFGLYGIGVLAVMQSDSNFDEWYMRVTDLEDFEATVRFTNMATDASVTSTLSVGGSTSVTLGSNSITWYYSSFSAVYEGRTQLIIDGYSDGLVSFQGGKHLKVLTSDTDLRGWFYRITAMEYVDDYEYCPDDCDLCDTSADCDDSDDSTKDLCDGTPKVCSNTAITSCNDDDGYCPGSCNAWTDNDCVANHECDVDSDCDDDDSATFDDCMDQLLERKCQWLDITWCQNDDGHCPDTCGYGNDNDCPLPEPDECSSASECDDSDVSTIDECWMNVTPTECKHITITDCVSLDDYCPPQCYYPDDTDCEYIDLCESNDQCSDGNVSTEDFCMGTPKHCIYSPITECRHADGYCPDGCNSVTDTDCNGGTEEGECTVNSDCDDSIDSTTDKCMGYPKKCYNEGITSCTNGDSYCPDGCTNSDDSDCPETDECISDADCADTKDSTLDKCSGTPLKCSNMAITYCQTGDGYCPDNCGYTFDQDCSEDDEMTEEEIEEQEEPLIPCSSDASCNDFVASTQDLCVSSYCRHLEITDCNNGDGYCPTTCTPSTDDDCTVTTDPEEEEYVPPEKKDPIITKDDDKIEEEFDEYICTDTGCFRQSESEETTSSDTPTRSLLTPEEKSNYICGDGTCSEQETCCEDCGCPKGHACRKGACVVENVQFVYDSLNNDLRFIDNSNSLEQDGYVKENEYIINSKEGGYRFDYKFIKDDKVARIKGTMDKDGNIVKIDVVKNNSSAWLYVVILFVVLGMSGGYIQFLKAHHHRKKKAHHKKMYHYAKQYIKHYKKHDYEHEDIKKALHEAGYHPHIVHKALKHVEHEEKHGEEKNFEDPHEDEPKFTKEIEKVEKEKKKD